MGPNHDIFEDGVCLAPKVWREMQRVPRYRFDQFGVLTVKSYFFQGSGSSGTWEGSGGGWRPSPSFSLFLSLSLSLTHTHYLSLTHTHTLPRSQVFAEAEATLADKTMQIATIQKSIVDIEAQ